MKRLPLPAHPPTQRIGPAFVLVVLTALLAGCANLESRPPVTPEQIVQMSKEGVPAADIVQKMRDAGTVYRLSGSQLARLKSEGVADEVLDYMQDTYLAQTWQRGAYAYGSYWGGPWAWGPYPYWWPGGYWGAPYWGPYWGPYPPYRPRPPHTHPPHRHPPGAHPPAAHPPAAPPPAAAPKPSGAPRPPPKASRPPPWRQQRN